MTEANHSCWFERSRYGLFIHWGVYSVAGRGEWVQNRERIGKEEYTKLYAEHFHAEHYEPEQWARKALEWGVGYVVLTCRHHDGFALWPTAADDFHAGQIGPRRDLLRPYVEAVRRAGLKVGLYYSPANWNHPDYPGAYFRDWPSVADWQSPQARERFTAYYRAQLLELLSNYGDIDYLWYDGCIPADLQSAQINEELLRLQPHLLINERNGPPSHVRISEQAIRAPKESVRWEACMTLNDNWGWHGGDTNWKSPLAVIQMLCETAAGGGNLLLNIGPHADGTIPAASVAILDQVGQWLRLCGEAIRETRRSPFSWNNWGRVTVSGNRIFLNLYRPVGGQLCWAELRNKVLSARWLHDGSAIGFRQEGGRLWLLDLPEALPLLPVATIALEVEGEPTPITAQTSFWIPGEHV